MGTRSVMGTFTLCEFRDLRLRRQNIYVVVYWFHEFLNYTATNKKHFF